MLSLDFLPHGCTGSWNVCIPYPTQFCLMGTSMAISLIPEEFGKETLYLLTFSFFMQMDSRIFCRNQNIIMRKDNKSGRFSVKYLCGLLSPTHYPNNDFSFAGIWKGVVPPKVEIFCWMAIINRLNTRGVLVRRGVLDSSDSNCPICLVEEESVDHLILHCHKHWIIWSKIIKWWGLSWCCPKKFSGLFS
jgi:hypothetical protein